MPMRLGQIEAEGRVMAAILNGQSVRPIRTHTMIDIIQQAAREDAALPELSRSLAGPEIIDSRPVIPLNPVEVWACGCTYAKSAEFRDGDVGPRDSFYVEVYDSPRPEVFFKGTNRVCVGPDEAIGLRPDAKFTAPEPELAVILGGKGQIIGYSLANDVSAWDIERENPLYLPQSKIFNGCCALGPVIVTADEIPNPYQLEIACSVIRNGRTIFHDTASTARLRRRLEEMIEYLMRANSVPPGSVLLTGTGIIITEDVALAPGDEVVISNAEIGELSNTAQPV
jgi:2-dehydro-3-deoxy-D-arabinonate dehydratase